MYFNGTRNDSSRGAHGLPALISKGSPSPSLQKHAWFWMEQIAQHSSGSQLCVESWRVIEKCVTVQIRLYFARTQHSRTFLDGGNCGTMAGSPTLRPCRSFSCPKLLLFRLHQRARVQAEFNMVNWVKLDRQRSNNHQFYFLAIRPTLLLFAGQHPCTGVEWVFSAHNMMLIK